MDKATRIKVFLYFWTLISILVLLGLGLVYNLHMAATEGRIVKGCRGPCQGYYTLEHDPISFYMQTAITLFSLIGTAWFLSFIISLYIKKMFARAD
jgi:hypothetical protein